MNSAVAIIQARMGSSRLPGKTLADLAGKPLLERVIDQVGAANSIKEVIVVTSRLAEDDDIELLCESIGVRCYRGDGFNVLSRYAECLPLFSQSAIVRITADCPLHSPDTIDEVVEAFRTYDCDYVSNTNPYTRPDGQDVEVFSRDLLIKCADKASTEIELEHVTPWMRFSEGVKRSSYYHETSEFAKSHWSVDYKSDLDFVRRVWFELLKNKKEYYTFLEISEAIKRKGINMSNVIVNEGYYKSIYTSASDVKSKSLELSKSKEWLYRSDKVIPGGAQTYSKSWRHHIKGVTPIFLSSGKGSKVWDVDGNSYIDFIQGLLPNILGYADDRVNKAVLEQIKHGHCFSLPTPIEVELAEKLVSIIPCAEKVRFGKNGSDATTGAVRVARAYTGRERVATCGYHGWHDWYIGTTSRNIGVPSSTRELTSTFDYNSIDSLKHVLEKHSNEYAAVIMEPFNFVSPYDGYLEQVLELTHKHGALLIFDEICSGFHFGLGGAQKLFDVIPDLATFGKALGNGWPISCITGKSEIMDVFDDAFFSFTFGGDSSSIAAALKVISILENEDDYARMGSAGVKIRDGLKVFAKESGFGDNFIIKGHEHWMTFDFIDDSGKTDRILKTLWLQEVTRRGCLVLTTFNISSSLSDANVHDALTAFAGAFKYLSVCVKENLPLEECIDGEIPIPAFRARS
jgi:glutamate-1-semialdehyde 2,1-aminomutase